MAEEHDTLRKIEWSETFPFIRLFSTFKRAVSVWSLALAFLCVLTTYIAGRVMDRIWLDLDSGVTVARRMLGLRTEIEAYANMNGSDFRSWVNQAREAAKAPESLITEEQIAEKTSLLRERVEKGLKSIDEPADTSAEVRDQKRRQLHQAYDSLRLAIAGCAVTPDFEEYKALGLVLGDGRGEGDTGQMTELREFREFINKCRIKAEFNQLQPQGPFKAVLDYEMKCFASAIQGVCTGRFGFSGGALVGEPSMLGGIVSAGSGVIWLATQRPCFFVIFLLVLLVLHAYFGGAICRVTAVRIAREEGISASAALRFSREKFVSFITAPLLPAVVFLFIGFLIWVGGLIGAIPGLHPISSIFYGLTMIGGLILALLLILMACGFHLMWPTVAVEGSDAFDGIQRAFGYVMQRPWHTAFYSFVLLIYGAFSFVFVRLLALLTFKLSHMFLGRGMNLAGSAEIGSLGKLDAMWQMPAWQDLPLLPSTGDVGFWGTLNNAPLSGYESFTWFFFALWIFGIGVGLVGAFVLSFYYSGATEMYFLLRRTVDGVEFDEIYYEETEDELDAAFEPSATAEPPAPESKPADDKPAE